MENMKNPELLKSQNNSIGKKLNNQSHQNHTSKSHLSNGRHVDNSDEEKNNAGLQKQNLPIDKELSSSDYLIVQGSKVTCNSEIKNKHKFIFGQNIFESNIFSWKIHVNKKVGWMAFGISRPKKVIENNYSFSGNGNNSDHGCYLISSNGFFWNSNLKSQNNCKISHFSDIVVGDDVNFRFNKTAKTLEVFNNKFSTKLENISCEIEEIRPVAILMANGDEITFSN